MIALRLLFTFLGLCWAVASLGIGIPGIGAIAGNLGDDIRKGDGAMIVLSLLILPLTVAAVLVCAAMGACLVAASWLA